MLYTRKGDNGTTKLFDCPTGVRVNKSAFIFEVLGSLDELNSSLGYARALARKSNCFVLMKTGKASYDKILGIFQQNLFCIQAELGGSPIHATKEQVLFLEEVIYEIETLLPPIKSFILPGGTKMAACLDIARTITRRAERQTVILRDKQEKKIDDVSIQFLNRLSSALYALARWANYQEGFREEKPEYK